MRIGEVEIISMLICSPARVRNTVAATPGLVFMPAPMIETLAMSASAVTSAAPIWARRLRLASRPTTRSRTGIVNEMSVRPSSEVFCTIMSTFTSRSARALNSVADTPTRSGTPATVTLASPTSCTTADTMACSTTSSSGPTRVPGSHVNDERISRRTWWVRANSAALTSGFGHPAAHISSSSPHDRWGRRRAVGTTRGSAENTPDTSV